MASNDWDLVIVGAGIVGTMSAFLAQFLHKTRTLLIDENLVGNGASQYGIALRTPYASSQEAIQLVTRSEPIWNRLVEIFPSLPQRSVPSFWVVQSEDLSLLKSRLPTCRLRYPSESQRTNLLEHYPGLSLSSHENLLFSGNDFIGHPGSIAQFLARAFVRSGGTLLEGFTIDSFVSHTSGYEIRSRCTQTIRAKRLLFATGPWINESLRMEFPGLKEVRTKKVVAFNMNATVTSRTPIVQWLDPDAFLVPICGTGNIALSITSTDWDVLPKERELESSTQEQSYARSLLRKYVPHLATKTLGSRVFCDAYSSSGTPMTFPHSSSSNCVFAGAGSGAGYRLAPAIADNALEKLGFAPFSQCNVL